MRCALVVTPLSIVAALAGPLAAQCTTSWTPGNPLAGINGTVRAMASFDPTGTGTAVRIAVAGQFTLVGASFATNIAVFDVVAGTWQALGSGLSSTVFALAWMPNGDLIAGGELSSAGGVPVSDLARWDGTAWSSIGGVGGTGSVQALAVMPNADLVAGGSFTSIGGVPANNLARWNGTAWSSLGGGVNGHVTALHVMPNGDLVVAGTFVTAGSVAANCIARWNGATWSPLGLGILPPSPLAAAAVLSMAVAQNGDLIVGGLMTTAGGVPANRIASWNGATWSALGTGLDAAVKAVAVQANGDIVAAGDFTTAGGVPAQSIARWNGLIWSPMGPRVGRVSALTTLPGSGTLVASSAAVQPDVSYTSVASWSGSAWIPITGTGDIASVAAIATRGNRMTIGGAVFRVAGMVANRVAEWDGSSWNNLGGGTDGKVHAAAYLPNGDLVIGGAFTSAGATLASNIARWDGSAWHAFGVGTDGVVEVLAVSPGGQLFAAGRYSSIDGVPVNRLAKWNGVTWAGLGNPIWAVSDMAFAANGDLIAVGSIALPSAPTAIGIARWNGTAWSPMPGLGSYGRAVAIGPNGDVHVGVASVMSSTIRRWDGAAWSDFGSALLGELHALEILPNGDVVTAGYFTTAVGVPPDNIARWNGAAWTPFGAGADSSIDALAQLPDGSLAVGGRFASAGGVPAVGFTRLVSSCAPAAVAFGSGCSSSAGPVVLGATTLPWIGSTFRAVTTGVPASAVALAVSGFATASVPLASLLPQGVPGCLLLVTPDLLDASLPVAGSAVSTLAIPGSAALIGQTLHHQVVPVELGAAAITAVTSSNGLTLTIGSF
ncbi:MAG TPA: hypothetical protein VF384_13980 [Planctomycetota bacterium]